MPKYRQLTPRMIVDFCKVRLADILDADRRPCALGLPRGVVRTDLPTGPWKVDRLGTSRRHHPYLEATLKGARHQPQGNPWRGRQLQPRRPVPQLRLVHGRSTRRRGSAQFRNYRLESALGFLVDGIGHGALHVAHGIDDTDVHGGIGLHSLMPSLGMRRGYRLGFR